MWAGLDPAGREGDAGGGGPDEEGPVRVAERCEAAGIFCDWLGGREGKRYDRSRTAPRRSRSSVWTGELAS